MSTIRSHPGRKLTLLSIAAVLLSGCSDIWPGFEAPNVSVQSFRPIDTDDGTGLPAFEIGLQITNPNLEPLELAGISYTISLDGRDLIRGVGNELPVIEGYGEGAFTVTASFNVMAGIQVFRSLMDKDSDTFDYSFEAKLDPGRFKRKIHISDSGSISLSNP